MSDSDIVVENVRVIVGQNTTTLSGLVGGEYLYWTMPNRDSIAARGEPFVCAALISAMHQHRDIRLPVNAPVDARFLAAIEELQPIFAYWYPALRPITIRSEVIAPREGTAGSMVGYSGGVDASYSLAYLASRVDAALWIDGIEFREANPELNAHVDATLRSAAAGRGLPMVVVETNVKQVGVALGGIWSQFLGGALASVPHALGLAEYWIAASDTWSSLRPYGSHPLTDPLWSSAATAIRHHGADARRIDKTRFLATTPDLLDAVRVCFQGNDYNCGVCDKCLRTAAGLRAAGLTSRAMPPLTDPKVLRGVTITDDYELIDWVEILDDELESRDPAFARELRRLINRFVLRQTVQRFDEIITRGRLRRAVRRLRGKPAR